MTTLITPAAGAVLLLVALFVEFDPMAVHQDENPPNVAHATDIVNAPTGVRMVIPQMSWVWRPEPALSANVEGQAKAVPAEASLGGMDIADPVVTAAGGPLSASEEQFTEAQMRALAAQAGFSEEGMPALLTVTWCESRWSPGAVGRSAGEAGLAQIHPVNWGRFDQFPSPDPWNPLQNLIVAYQMSQGGTNYWAWTCKP